MAGKYWAMKHSILLIAISLLTIVNGLGQDVRNCTWGMSMQQVEEAEGVRPVKVEKDFYRYGSNGPEYTDIVTVEYSATIDYREVRILYKFKSNKLVGATLCVNWATHDKNRTTTAGRLFAFRDIFNYLVKDKNYRVNKNWIKGGFYSDIYLPSNVICTDEVQFGIWWEDQFSEVAKCIDNYRFSYNDQMYGLTMTNGRTNVLVNFPTPMNIRDNSDLFSRLIGWVKYESAVEVKVNKY